MRLKEGFIVRDVAGQTVVLPYSEELDLNMMITLNDTGKFIWEQLQSEQDEDSLVAALLGEYDVDGDRARACVRDFVSKLHENGFLA